LLFGRGPLSVIFDRSGQSCLADDPETFGKSVTNMRGCFSPNGLVAPDGPAHVLDILAASEPELKKASINLADTYTNAFVEEALKKYPPKQK